MTHYIANLKAVFLLLILLFTSATHSPAGETLLKSAYQAAAQGRYNKGIQALQQVISQGDAPESIWIDLAGFYVYDNQIKAGRAFFASHKDNFAASLALAVLEKDAGNPGVAFDTCRSALQKGATSPRFIEILVSTSLAVGNTKRLPQILRLLKRNERQKDLYDLGYAFWRFEMGNYLRARQSIEAYILARPQDYVGHWVAARILQKLGDSAGSKSKLLSALSLLDADQRRQKILISKVLAESYHPNQPDSTEHYLNQALVLAHGKGALKELYAIDRFAIDFYQTLKLYQPLADRCIEAIRIARKLKFGAHLSDMRYTLALAYQGMHDTDRALQQYSKIIAETNDPELAARCHLNMGQILMDSEPRRAFDALQKSYDLAKKSRLQGVKYDAQMQMADLYLSFGDFKKAKKAYQEVVWYGQRTQQHFVTEAGFLRLSQLYRVSENRKIHSATYYINMADALTRQTSNMQFAPYHRLQQGDMALEEGKIERAEIYFIEAVQLGRETEVFLPVLAGHAGLVRTYLAAEFEMLSATHSDSVLNYVRDVLWVSDSPAFKNLHLKKDVFAPMVKAYSIVGDLSRIFQTSQLFKGLSQSLDLQPIKHRLILSKPQRWKLEILNHKLNLKLQSFWELLNLETRENLEQFNSLRNDLAHLRMERSELLDNMKGNDDNYCRILRPDFIDEKEVQTDLRRRGSAFVDYFVAEEATFITVITPSDIYCKRVNIEASYLRDLVYGLSPLFDPESNKGDAAGRDAFRMDHAGELYQLLFEPIVPWLSGLDRVIISAEDFLNRLPFESLVTNSVSLTDEYDYVNAKFLVENYAVSYLALAGQLTGKAEQHKPLRILTALGGSASSPNRESQNGKPEYGTEQIPADYEQEVFAVAREIDENKSLVFLDGHATTSNFFEGMENSQILHITLPALYNDEHPLFSKIYFAGSSEPDSVEVADFFGMNSSADLFVLSSSERAFDTKHTLSPESIFLRALRTCGVQTQIAATWQTKDPNFSKLLISFYSHLKQGQALSVALQSAKKEFIATVHRNPYYWSSLVLSGEPGNLNMIEDSRGMVIALGLIGFFVLVSLLAWHLFRLKRE